MVQFIEKHRRLLQAYCLIARILGWYLFGAGLFWFFVLVSGDLIAGREQQIDFILYIVFGLISGFIIPGLLAFSVSGFLDYILRSETRPNLILIMTDKLCYGYALFLILKDLAADFWFENVKFIEISGFSNSNRILLVQPLLGPTVAKALLLIGIGMILHRLLPVIEESKTLV